MFQDSLISPTLVPLCGPVDTVELIGSCRGTGRYAHRREWIYVVVHRSHGLWTHVYVAIEEFDRGAGEIRLVRVMPGDRFAEARAWVLAMRDDDVGGQARGNGNGLSGWKLVWCGRDIVAGERAVAAVDLNGSALYDSGGGLRLAPMPVESATANVPAGHQEEVV